MDQINLLSAVVGIFGLGLVINSVAIVLSSKYYSFFNKTYFIESASGAGRALIKRKIQGQEYNAQRYGLSIISVGLGLVAIFWSLGMLESIPFFVLAVVALLLAFIFKFIKR